MTEVGEGVKLVYEPVEEPLRWLIQRPRWVPSEAAFQREVMRAVLGTSDTSVITLTSRPQRRRERVARQRRGRLSALRREMEAIVDEARKQQQDWSEVEPVLRKRANEYGRIAAALEGS